MSDILPRLADRAAELRRAFDLAFAEAVRRDATPMENLLAFSLGPEPYALRLSNIAGLFVDRKITRAPGGHEALLGFAGFRGAVAPVYDLHVLLGRPRTETPRWLAITSGVPVALAFETFDGHLRVPRDAIMAQDAGGQSRRMVREVASAAGLVRPIVHLPSVLGAIGRRRSDANEEKE